MITPSYLLLTSFSLFILPPLTSSFQLFLLPLHIPFSYLSILPLHRISSSYLFLLPLLLTSPYLLLSPLPLLPPLTSSYIFLPPLLPSIFFPLSFINPSPTLPSPLRPIPMPPSRSSSLARVSFPVSVHSSQIYLLPSLRRRGERGEPSYLRLAYHRLPPPPPQHTERPEGRTETRDPPPPWNDRQDQAVDGGEGRELPHHMRDSRLADAAYDRQQPEDIGVE